MSKFFTFWDRYRIRLSGPCARAFEKFQLKTCYEKSIQNRVRETGGHSFFFRFFLRYLENKAGVLGKKKKKKMGQRKGKKINKRNEGEETKVSISSQLSTFIKKK